MVDGDERMYGDEMMSKYDDVHYFDECDGECGM